MSTGTLLSSLNPIHVSLCVRYQYDVMLTEKYSLQGNTKQIEYWEQSEQEIKDEMIDEGFSAAEVMELTKEVMADFLSMSIEQVQTLYTWRLMVSTNRLKVLNAMRSSARA